MKIDEVRFAVKDLFFAGIVAGQERFFGEAAINHPRRPAQGQNHDPLIEDIPHPLNPSPPRTNFMDDSGK